MATIPNSNIWSPLSHGVAEIRLVVIEPSQSSQDSISCLMQNFPLSAIPAYQALSYTWGDTKVTEKIHLNGYPFEATINLHAALKRLRSRQDIKHLWIDALCINQSSTSEKNYQIPLMGRIYSEASRVLIWLGQEADNSSLAFDYIKRCGEALEMVVRTCPDHIRNNFAMLRAVPAEIVHESQSHLSLLLSNLLDERGTDPIVALIEREYWKRIWVVQEIVLGQSPILLCGGDELDFQVFWGVIMTRNLYKFFCDVASQGVVTAFDHDDQAFRTIGSIRARRTLFHSKGQVYQTHLWDLMNDFKSSLSTDRRDRIYGLLGLLDPKKVPAEVDYNLDFDDIYIKTITSLIKHSNARDVSKIITNAGIGRAHPSTKTHCQLPSWVPRRLLQESVAYETDLLEWISPSPIFRSKAPHKHAEMAWQFLSSGLLKTTGILCDDILRVACPISLSSQEGQPTDVFTWSNIWQWLELARTCHDRELSHVLGWRRTFLHILTGFRNEEIFRYLDQGGVPTLIDRDELTPDVNVMEALLVKQFTLMMKVLVLEEIEPSPTESIQLKQAVLLLSQSKSPSASHCSTPLQNFINDEIAYWLAYLSDINDVDETYDWHEAWSTTKKEMEGPEFQKFMSVAKGLLRERSFFITRSGYMGLGPRYIEAGDRVCMLSGCELPMIVRKAQPNFVIVGGAIIPGMLEGEMTEQVERGERKVEDIMFQ